MFADLIKDIFDLNKLYWYIQEANEDEYEIEDEEEDYTYIA
jgi:hypothetical protein